MAERVLFDVNVVLDAILQRAPHVVAAEQLWAMVERGEIRGYIPAHGVTTIFYLLRKSLGSEGATTTVGALLQVFRVAPVDAHVLAAALASGFPDFGDAACAAAAAASQCTTILTCDPKGFAGSLVPAVSPEGLVARAAAKPSTPTSKRRTKRSR